MKNIKIPTEKGKKRLGNLIKEGREAIGTLEQMEALIEQTIGHRIPKSTFNQIEGGQVELKLKTLVILESFAAEYFKRGGRFLINKKSGKPYTWVELRQILCEELKP